MSEFMDELRRIVAKGDADFLGRQRPVARPDILEAKDALYFGARTKGEVCCGPGMCIVPTRYQGCYEGGMFAAIPIVDLNSAAFGDDCSAADWWYYNRDRVGVGPTPTDALMDWYAKAKVPA